MLGAPTAPVDEASSAVREAVELLGDLEYHFGVLRSDIDGGVCPVEGGCSLYLVLSICPFQTKTYSFNRFVNTPPLNV